MGRPISKNPRRNVLSIKLTDDEYARLLQRATTLGGHTVSSYARNALMGWEGYKINLIGMATANRLRRDAKFRAETMRDADRLMKKALGKR